MFLRGRSGLRSVQAQCDTSKSLKQPISGSHLNGFISGKSINLSKTHVYGKFSLETYVFLTEINLEREGEWVSKLPK